MKAALPRKVRGGVPLDQILGSAVVLNWNALASGATDSLVKIEYHIGADGALEYLRLWARAREYWSLVCEYSASLGWSDGPRFLNGFHSRSLGRLLQSIMLNRDLFQHECTPNSNSIIEVGAPTEEETTYATLRVNEAFQSQP
jgi:hypothetical protein